MTDHIECQCKDKRIYVDSKKDQKCNVYILITFDRTELLAKVKRLVEANFLFNSE